MSSIFKSYDIRGIYPDEIDEASAEKIGRAVVHLFRAKSIAVGRDARTSSPSLFIALCKGITEAGAQVYDIGLISTPMLYFASAKLPVEAGIMITASHNPPKYNGIKICKKNAIPIGLESGLREIENFTKAEQPENSPRIGVIRPSNITDAYYAYLKTFAHFGGKSFHIVTDTANAMGVKELPIFHHLKSVAVTAELYNDLGKPCSHEANPLKTETLIELQHVVRSTKADMGIAYDGDADRIGFVDENGHVVPMDIILALLAKGMLQKYPKATILYDVRCSRSVAETIEALGGKAIETKVGHANIKRHMKETGAVLAGEIAGHFYFSEGGYIAEMGSLPAILIMNLMAESGKRLCDLAGEISHYVHSGEINFSVKDSAELFRKVREQYKNTNMSELDGIKVSFSDWWFSIRASNTEPLVRLNLEATTRGNMELHKQELIRLIQPT